MNPKSDVSKNPGRIKEKGHYYSLRTSAGKVARLFQIHSLSLEDFHLGGTINEWVQ